MDDKKEGFHVICGTSPKNGIDGIIPGITPLSKDVSCGVGNKILDLSRMNSLLVADLDYFVEHNEEILEVVKKTIENRESDEYEERGRK